MIDCSHDGCSQLYQKSSVRNGAVTIVGEARHSTSGTVTGRVDVNSYPLLALRSLSRSVCLFGPTWTIVRPNCRQLSYHSALGAALTVWQDQPNRLGGGSAWPLV